jgi:hypothetical protein
MADHVKNFLPRFRYGMIHPRSHENRNRGAGYQFYRLVRPGIIPPVQGWGRLLAMGRQ